MAWSVAVALFAFFLAVSPIISSAPSCPFRDSEHHNHLHEESSIVHGRSGCCDHSHHHHHGNDHPHHHEQEHEHDHHHSARDTFRSYKLAEELAEEEELALYGLEQHSHSEDNHYHQHVRRASIGIWLRALGCSLLVSMASLICLVLLPFIVAEGRPSRIVVDFLAAFGAGAMLGDAFLHQLPHALGDAHNHGHMHEHHDHDHSHHNAHDDGHGHAHSIQDLSVGLAILAGIILFFIVEKIVRQVEKSSSKGASSWIHHHHHHHHDHHLHEQCPDEDSDDKHQEACINEGQEIVSEKESSEENLDDSVREKSSNTHEPYRRKNLQKEVLKEGVSLLPEKDESGRKAALTPVTAPNLILGYLNLFSDGVHNFTDGMALGSAFLNHGTIGGWSRTLFLLAHEIPQEVGDFGILLQSGFTVFKALVFNFLSALVALAGTALALLWGGSPENSSLIEGFTAGGFIYIAVAGVMPEMHQTGTSAKITVVQLVALSLGMSVALLISLIE